MQDWKTRDQIAGVENMGPENAGPNRMGRYGRKSQDWKTRDQVHRGGKCGTGKHGNIICMDSET